MKKDQIITSVSTIISLAQDIDEKLSPYCEICNRFNSEDRIKLNIFYTEGYDWRLKKEIENSKSFFINLETYWEKELFEINDFVDELEHLSYDDEMDTISDKKEARGEELLNAYRGKQYLFYMY